MISLIERLRQKVCPHHWVVLYRGKMETLRKCQYCGKEVWMKN